MRTISEFLRDHERDKGSATISFKRFEEAFDEIVRLQAALEPFAEIKTQPPVIDGPYFTDHRADWHKICEVARALLPVRRRG